MGAFDPLPQGLVLDHLVNPLPAVFVHQRAVIIPDKAIKPRFREGRQGIALPHLSDCGCRDAVHPFAAARAGLHGVAI